MSATVKPGNPFHTDLVNLHGISLVVTIKCQCLYCMHPYKHKLTSTSMSQRLSTRIYSLFPAAKPRLPESFKPMISRMEMMMEAEVGILACYTWVYDQPLTASIRTLYLSLKTKHEVHLHPSNGHGLHFYGIKLVDAKMRLDILVAPCNLFVQLLPHYNTFSYLLHAFLFFQYEGY